MVSEEVVVPVHAGVELNEEEVALLELTQKRTRIVLFGHGGAALKIENIEDRRCEQKIADFRWLNLEYLRAEKVHHRARSLGEGADQRVRVRMAAERDRRHLHAGGPAVGAIGDQLDLGGCEIDLELAHHSGHLGGGEPKVGVSNLDEPAIAAKPVQSQLRLRPTADDDTTVVRKAVDERGQAGCGRRREMEVVDDEQHRSIDLRDVVDRGDSDLVKVRIWIVEEVEHFDAAVGPSAP